MEYTLNTIEEILEDIKAGKPVVIMDDENREQLRHLLTFKLKKHSRYNLSDHEITLIEKQVRKRAKLLLK